MGLTHLFLQRICGNTKAKNQFLDQNAWFRDQKWVGTNFGHNHVLDMVGQRSESKKIIYFC